MKHSKKVTIPVRACMDDAWWWMIGGVAGGLAIDEFITDPKKEVDP